MKVAFISSVYPPENEPSAIMAAELAGEWALVGHQVQMICPFPNRPRGVVHSGFRRMVFKTSVENGVRVTRVWTCLIGPGRKHWNRVLENISFGISSACVLLFVRKVDVVIVQAWPILARLPIVAIANLRRISTINYVKDLYPEAAVAAGLFRKNSFLDRILLRVDTLIHQRSTCSVVISDSVRDWIIRTRDLPISKVQVIRDWLDLNTIRPFEGKCSWRDDVGISREDKVFMYAGTMGYASRVDVLTKVAISIKAKPGLRIVCVGEGVLKEKMERERLTRNLTNMTILPFQPRARVPEMQSCADVMLLITSRNMGISSIPSKFITYLAVGKPILLAGNLASDIAQLVMDNGVGMVVEPENPEAIAKGIECFSALGPAALHAMSVRARGLAMKQYSMDRALLEFDDLLCTYGTGAGRSVPRTSEIPLVGVSTVATQEPQSSTHHIHGRISKEARTRGAWRGK